MRSAYGKPEFMYSNFFTAIRIWNYMVDDLDINVTFPKFKNL